MPSRRRIWFLLGVLLLIGVGTCGWWGWRRWQVQHWRLALQQAFASQQYSTVEQLAQNLQSVGNADLRVVQLAGEAAHKDRRFEDAIKWYRAIPPQSAAGLDAQAAIAEIDLLSLHRLTPAEQELRQILEADPDHIFARQQLAGLLGLVGRTREASVERVELLQRQRFTALDLILMGLRDTSLENADWLPDFQRDSPDDPLTQSALGHSDYRNHHLREAEGHLRRALELNPALHAAQCWLGSLLVDEHRWPELQSWHGTLTPAAFDLPEIWVVMGDWAREQGTAREAIRCYCEAIRRDSLQQHACHQAGQLLQKEGHKTADRFLKRSALLQDFLLGVKRFHAVQDATPLRQIVTSCEQLGLLWEAWGWAQIAQKMLPQQHWPAQTVERLQPKLKPGLPRVLVSTDPTNFIQLDDWPLPDVARWSASSSQRQPAAGSGAIRFRDDAASLGLNFVYENGHDDAFGGRRIFEFAGGGVGVLDFDNDGWPDLYFTQGTRWPPQPGQRTHLDRLFHNQLGQQMQDVTESARLVEDRYSQGLSVADWNNDGFADVFVANVGRNRLFVNNGDGTFSDVTEEAGVAGDSWTTSCVVVDVNGDTWPDVYAVNYLAGDDLYNRLCRRSDGTPRTCTPHDLDPAPDEFYLNQGDGTFRSALAECGLKVPTGKGLGIVAGDLDGSRKISLFVANDTDGNLFFRNVSEPGTCRFVEESVPAGLAYDQAGKSMACMGVAAGDANGDGLLDLYVSNYFAESNVLYLQQSEGIFQDAAQSAGLRIPSLNMLGFGTQFLDADLDGNQDLVLVNGHVDDESKRGIPYRMRPQFFHNTGQGRFVELNADDLGPWFQRETLGRGLARLDWNRDGRPDFVVTHLDHPAALLTNLSVSQGSAMECRLIGRHCSRDAIGTRVEFIGDNCSRIVQLTNGDGYQSSNQRSLMCSLPNGEPTQKIRIFWSSGAIQEVETTTGKSHEVVVETH